MVYVIISPTPSPTSSVVVPLSHLCLETAGTSATAGDWKEWEKLHVIHHPYMRRIESKCTGSNLT